MLRSVASSNENGSDLLPLRHPRLCTVAESMKVAAQESKISRIFFPNRWLLSKIDFRRAKPKAQGRNLTIFFWIQGAAVEGC